VRLLSAGRVSRAKFLLDLRIESGLFDVSRSRTPHPSRNEESDNPRAARATGPPRIASGSFSEFQFGMAGR